MASRRRDPQDIANTTDAVNQAWLTLVNLAPQVADARLHHVAAVGGIVIPDMIEYLSLAEDMPGVHIRNRSSLNSVGVSEMRMPSRLTS